MSVVAEVEVESALPGAPLPADSAPPQVRLFGIRHHGPGSALALRRALQSWWPDIVLIEGPREAEAIAHLAAHPHMHPPVTMLGYSLDHPERAVFYPGENSFTPDVLAVVDVSLHKRDCWMVSQEERGLDVIIEFFY